ncbi:hypothetical protein Halha_0342 [Halobacteroides halobius DSM 5150]|uniref:Uncharacterized protein n=1 Tax=Halobacteroides halobius (strain ATCC 35273 / DSM 5150 / MD-1) TaxID=748449 RepID=L0K7N0_HALHC|nr:hypothetical protein [Halobacteroides halobius]AGB40349.1 hypothetical protein Halha_0342 [Halobacteroides halobius DSM 5150]
MLKRILLGIFCIFYFEIVESYFLNYKFTAAGVFLIIGGSLGLLADRMLFRTGYNRKKQAIVVNVILLIIGIAMTVYYFIN